MKTNHLVKFAYLVLALIAVLGNSASAQELSKLIPYPFYTVQNNAQNRVMLIDDGIAALSLRVGMIRRAQQSIAIEYFIFNTDTAGRIVLKELVAAAARGVKVRVLVDKSVAVFKLDEFYAKALSAKNVDVRYYNDSALWRVSSLQFRTHRKMILVDDREGITGGRNIGDDYFDLSPEFNFDDSDIHVEGPIVKTMRESYDKFWDNDMTARPTFPQPPRLRGNGDYALKTRQAENLLTVTTRGEVAARQRMQSAGVSYLRRKEAHVCPTLTFSSDAPGANLIRRSREDFIDKHRFLRKTLHDKISKVDKQITLSSPYMINGDETDLMLSRLVKNGAKIELYTNSLGSTDAIYVAANMYLGLKDWRALGIEVFLHQGKYMGKNPQSPAFVQNAKSGTHSKVQVYQSKTGSEVMIGTYNIDHRSNYYNAEMALFCKGNDRFTSEVLASVHRNMELGLEVNKDASAATDKNGVSHSVHSATFWDVVKMKALTLPSWLGKMLI